MRDDLGNPIQVPNGEYLWDVLEKKDPEKYAQLRWKNSYDMKKLMKMHPLIGKELRPFELHPVDENGCTVCHSGNGRSIQTERAHGPVFDGQYEAEFMGPKPEFLEIDPEHDPLFSKVFNDKPGHELLFQTTPIYVGGLIEANCMQCHTRGEKGDREALKEGIEDEKRAVKEARDLYLAIEKEGFERVRKKLEITDYTLPFEAQQQRESQLWFMTQHGEETLDALKQLLINSLGSDAFLESGELKPQLGGTLNAKMQKLNEDIPSTVDQLTAGYARGKNHFIYQGCYACHRIAGFSRGGVGPELTWSGLSYPWYIKESIVCPQADLKTSTMPNVRLDHEELENLVTYLLAQKGRTEAVSPTAYKIAIQEWEAGKKQPWEEAVTPVEMRDVNYGLTVFATEGCASCHRLKGFTSDVGYKDKGNREWFTGLFPEDMLGSDLVKIVEAHQAEIDQRIVSDVRSGSILEAIEQNHPQLIASFYAPFKFALRAKGEDAEWQERIRRVLMMYVQEYGLGRLIGPRPNWSGIYRSDEWLVEHFRNPSRHVARSIMPLMPFDETKYFALTYMLDVMALKNRDDVRKQFAGEGFNPQKAYSLLCAQCHGEYQQGNGPIAEWIYPIPKNLNKPDFLRNLTPQKAAESIVHGVKGGPMPPWGEVAMDKPMADGKPVLTQDEVNQLVDWIYSTLPGGRVLREQQDVPKWQYSPDDVIRELIQEGVEWERPLSSGFFPRLHAEETFPITDIFDVTENSQTGEPFYRIKKEFYTAKNLAAGQAFFHENCSVCHGGEADGAGPRAEAMEEAKPRMLTNLDWLDTRDDLRLLRSIKYGVAGTSMIAWGDVTTGLQRLQLVMYIRSLSEKAEKRELVMGAIYRAFDAQEVVVQQARVQEWAAVEKVEQEIAAVQQKLNDNPNADLYGELLEKEKELEKAKSFDHWLVALIEEHKKEKELYESLGVIFLTTPLPDRYLQEYVSLITLNEGRYFLKNKHLDGNYSSEEFQPLYSSLLTQIQSEIEQLTHDVKVLGGKLTSSTVDEKRKEQQSRLDSL
ncbi:MAG: c-type cytochrome, partial [Chlamydiia bacterium]|nr:c-type cytochrome [Chlamydiia bacterium]